MKKHYIKHTLNKLQDFLSDRIYDKDSYYEASEMIAEIRKELDKDDDKREV